jgi:NTP pyrophosphatase (non-canonical NTP hydrolase)
MNFTEYQTAAMQTAGDLTGTTQLDGLITTALGLCGETRELCREIDVGGWHDEDLIIKEFGDCLWYVARGCYALNIDMGAVFNFESVDACKSTEKQRYQWKLDVHDAAGAFADTVKKSHAQGHPVDARKLIGLLTYYCSRLSTLLSLFNDAITLGEVMEANIAKLKERFPDGFDSQTSQARYQVAADTITSWVEESEAELALADQSNQKSQQAEAVLVARYGSITEGLGDN